MFLRRKHEDEDNENLDRWLLTYADMITLLLAFFIVMYSMSRVDIAKFKNVAKALNVVLDGKSKTSEAAMSDLKGLVKDHAQKGDLINLQKQIDEISRQMKLGLQIKTELTKRGLVIHISESAFFDPGKAELKPQAMEILDLLAVQLLKIPNHLRVEGHTDNLPISTSKYPSNWELSTARATTCLRYLVEKNNFPPERISALGYAEYRPIATNTTSEGRNKNRRVDMIVLAPDDATIEPVNMTGEPSSPPRSPMPVDTSVDNRSNYSTGQ